MNNKKVWIMAVVFGLIMSVLFYFLISNNKEETSPIYESPPLGEELGEKEELQQVDEEILEVESGKRAVSIPVDEIQSVSGFVRPNSYVDIIAVIEKESAHILLDNVHVLAVGKTFAQEEVENQEPYNMVTFELTPAQGVKLSLARENGTVTLMLRGTDDKEPSPNAFTVKEHLIKGQMPQ